MQSIHSCGAGDDATPKKSKEPDFLTEHEVADLLNVKVATLRRWRWEGSHLAYHKFSGLVRYARAEVQAFIADSARKSTSDTGAAA
jgi:hypothetical protein